VQDRRAGREIRGRQNRLHRCRVLPDDARADFEGGGRVVEAQLHDLDGNDPETIGPGVANGKQSCLPSGLRRLDPPKNHRGFTVI